MVKRIILSLLIIFSLSISAFAEFEMLLNIPLEININFVNVKGKSGHMIYPYGINIDYSTMKGFIGYDAAVLMQIGGSFDLKKEKGLTSISLLADIGYQRNTYTQMFH